MSNDNSGLTGLVALIALVAAVLLWRASKQSTSNAETWQIERDPVTGRLRGVEVHREVRLQ